MNDDAAAPSASPGTPQFEQRKAGDWPQILTEIGFDGMSRKDRREFLDHWAWLLQHQRDWASTYDGLMTWAAALKSSSAEQQKADDEENREKRRINKRNLSLLSIAVVFACGVMGAGSAIIANAVSRSNITVTVKSTGGEVLPTLLPQPTATPP